MMQRFFDRIKNEKGSASVEFVMLGIPLFLPVLLYLNQFSSLSWAEETTRVIARETLRAYISSSDDGDGQYVASQAVHIIGLARGLSQRENDSISLSFSCSKQPCLSPSSVVKIKVSMKLDDGRTVEAIAQEHLSPWS